jgi:hypothetical protein
LFRCRTICFRRLVQEPAEARRGIRKNSDASGHPPELLRIQLQGTAVSERFARRLTLVLLAFLGIAATVGRCSAAGRRGSDGTLAAKKPPQPIFVLNAAGFDRVLGSADGLLKMVERPQLSLALRGLLAISTNGLKGIDHKRPVGLMTFINPGETPEPVGVVYVPVTSGPEFLGSLKALEFAVKPAAGLAGGYQVTAGQQAFAVKIRGRYAFLARILPSLERELGDPAARFARLSRQFDVCVRFQLDATPPGLKAMVLDYVRASAEMGFEIRRGETTAAHRLRKAVGTAILHGFEEAVRDGDSLTLGLKVSQSSPGVLLEARLAARDGSPLANGLNDLHSEGGKRKAESGKRTNPPGSRLSTLDSRLSNTPSADFRLAMNWKPPASLVPVLNALVALLPAPQAGDAGRKSEWPRLRSGLFATGIRLVAWSSGGTALQPATIAVLSFPDADAAAAQVQSALSEFRSRGIVRTEKVAVAPNVRAKLQRVTWPAGAAANTAGAVALVSSTAWVAVGRGKILALLQREMKSAAAPRPPADSPIKPDDLFHCSGRWSAVKSLLRNGTWSVPPAVPPATGSTPERFEVTIAHEPNALVLRATVPPTAVRDATAPILKRLVPR